MCIAAVVFHRCQQMLSGKENLDTHYGTAYAFRNAANQRHDVASSVDSLIKMMRTDISKLNVANQRQVPITIPLNTPPRNTRQQEEAPQRFFWGPSVETGFTPCRGRPVNEDHGQREALCDGQTLMYVVADPTKANSPKDVRQPCRLCGTKTNFYCSCWRVARAAQ